MINDYCPAGTSYHLKKMDGLVVKEYENTLKYALAHCQAKTSPAATSCVKMCAFAPCSDKVWYTCGVFFFWSSTGRGDYQLWLYGKDLCWANNDRIFIFDWTFPLIAEFEMHYIRKYQTVCGPITFLFSLTSDFKLHFNELRKFWALKTLPWRYKILGSPAGPEVFTLSIPKTLIKTLIHDCTHLTTYAFQIKINRLEEPHEALYNFKHSIMIWLYCIYMGLPFHFYKIYITV